MTTLTELIESIHTSLHSYTGLHEQTTWLTSPVDEADTTMLIAGTSEVLRGVAEIDNELIYVHTSDGGTLNIPPFGRGYRGSTAVSHTADTPITWDPAFPRAEIRRSITHAIAALYPSLFRVTTTQFDYEANTVGFELPAEAEGVLRVQIKVPGDPTVDNWVDHARWDFDPHSPLATGKAINFYNGLLVGTTVRVSWAGRFGAFASDSDTLENVGLSDSYADLLTYAVTSRMIRFLDPARLTLGSVENVSRATVVQAGDAGRLANQLYAMYQTRLAEERRRLLALFPAQIHFLSR